MKPYKSITLPDDFVKIIGEEWAGTYTVHILTASEYISILNKLQLDALLKSNQTGEAKQNNVVATVTDGDLCNAIVGEAVTFTRGDCVRKLSEYTEYPSKLYEVFSQIAIPINTLSQAEGQQLYRLFR